MTFRISYLASKFNECQIGQLQLHVSKYCPVLPEAWAHAGAHTEPLYTFTLLSQFMLFASINLLSSFLVVALCSLPYLATPLMPASPCYTLRTNYLFSLLRDFSRFCRAFEERVLRKPLSFPIMICMARHCLTQSVSVILRKKSISILVCWLGQ